jgi:hypothetical protein
MKLRRAEARTRNRQRESSGVSRRGDRQDERERDPSDAGRATAYPDHTALRDVTVAWDFRGLCSPSPHWVGVAALSLQKRLPKMPLA